MRPHTLIYCQSALLASAVAAAQFDEYILAPSSRTLVPVSVYQTGGDVQDASNLVDLASQSATTLNGEGAYVTLDFGKNIAGTVGFQVDSLDGDNEAIGFTFTESSMWISAEYCDATQDGGASDLPLWFNLTGPGYYEADKTHQRGGFRYLTVVHNATGTVSISNLTVYWIASPEMADPAAYTGYFHSDSEKLNRVWYAGAYTNQLCSIDPTTGNSLGLPTSDWLYNYTISNGTSVLVDGGKRDRLVWPGDIAISGPSIFVSTNSLDPIRNGIDSLFDLQQEDGRLPYAGRPFNEFVGDKTNSTVFLWSFTYHCHTLNDLYDYYLFTGDLDYVVSYWDQYKLGVNYVVQTIDSTGLANVTSSADWLRNGMGGHNIEANSILYFTLQNALKLAAVVNDTSDASNWTTSAAGIPPAANALLWDDAASLYRDNDTQNILYPQDGNAWAIIAGIADSTRGSAISDSLAARWIRPYGAPAPEGGVTISPFVSGFEIQAHYKVGRADRAVDLLEFMWADFMLDDPRVTNSSFIEGYSSDGSLSYPAYPGGDARVSHAHGWATGPTSSLSFLGAGIQLTAGAGASWKIAPALGGVDSIEAGYETPLGTFSASWNNGTAGFTGSFETPEGTSGAFEILVTAAWKKLSLTGPAGVTKLDVTGLTSASVDNLAGGKYTVSISSC